MLQPNRANPRMNLRAAFLHFKKELARSDSVSGLHFVPLHMKRVETDNTHRTSLFYLICNRIFPLSIFYLIEKMSRSPVLCFLNQRVHKCTYTIKVQVSILYSIYTTLLAKGFYISSFSTRQTGKRKSGE